MTTARTHPARVVLVGHPVAHSRSPHFQNAAFAAAGIPLQYGTLDVPPGALETTLGELKAARAAGNVTIPHKESAAEACDRLTPIAERVGAVNTFWVEDGLLWGDNTDVAGFDAAVVALGTPRRHATVLCLGAGGAAAAVCAAVVHWPGARVVLRARSPARAARLASRFPDIVSLETDRELASGHLTLLVNATPLGMHGELTPIPVAEIPRDADVMDLVYREGETTLVREARARGHSAMDGREMLLQQGALAFTRWFGVAPDLDVMRRALETAG